MKSLPKTYEPQALEASIYQHWETSGYFNPDQLPNAKRRKPFSISMPPPNVTGELHIGQALDLTTQDILIRWHRMLGDASLWVPGTDHAGIATQILVERMLRETGISRYQIGRERFLRHVWQWKEKYGERIIEQIKRLGASCDWSREHFTMDPTLTAAVQTAFLKLYRDGLIFRGERVIHWCMEDQTGISDLEVEYREEQGTLWYIRYPLVGNEGSITVASARPETMLGDTAVAVHPKDKRYHSLIGKTVRIPVVGRVIPIIADGVVDQQFGTGAVKVTPAHDAADFEIARRHSLPALSVIGKNGRITSLAGKEFQGLTIHAARELLLQLLHEAAVIEREEPYTHSVAYCSRSNTVIEPLLSKQWFVKTKPLAQKALAALRAQKTKVVPDRFTIVLVRWLQNIRDWNISRQLWWGHRIPIWYCIACDTPVASVKEPKTRCKNCGDNAFRQDEDTLDTWFSSGLWTFSTLGWPAKTRDLKRFHPTSVLGTGWDILFFWVARMMMLSLYFTNQVPFKTVYIHGLILDEHGKKMSKSKGTGVDPLPMTQKYGTDALRLSLVAGSAPGQDFRMSEAKISHLRNFCNKLWNVARYVLSQVSPPKIGGEKAKPRGGSLADKWVLVRLNDVTRDVTKYLKKYQFSLAVEALQKFLWHDFADWYVEIHKVEKNTALLRAVLRDYLIVLHPFAPFITETLWSALGEKSGDAGSGSPGKLLLIEPWPKLAKLSAVQHTALKEFSQFQRLVIELRNLKIHGAGNQSTAVQSTTKLNRDLLTKLAGVTFMDQIPKDAIRIIIASEQLMVDAAIASRYNAWRTKEREQLQRYIAQKRHIADNNKVPQQVRESAQISVRDAQERLTELG